MILRKITAAVTVAFLLSSVAQATEPSPGAQAMMRQANAANGYMDKKLHDDFWDEVKRSVAPDPSGAKLKAVQETLGDMTMKNTVYPMEGWKSALLSLKKGSVVRTPELVRQTKLLKDQGIPGFDKAEASTDRLLKAAATGTPLNMNGQSMKIDEELVSQVLDGMDASISRLKVLTNPEWSDSLVVQAIPKMGLTISAHEKFVVSKLNNAGVPGYKASRNANTLQEQIAVLDFSKKPEIDLDGIVRSAFSGATSSAGLNEQPAPTTWKGLNGVSATGQVDVGGKSARMAIHVLKRAKNHSVMMVITIVEGNGDAARAAQDSLLKRIKLI